MPPAGARRRNSCGAPSICPILGSGPPGTLRGPIGRDPIAMKLETSLLCAKGRASRSLVALASALVLAAQPALILAEDAAKAAPQPAPAAATSAAPGTAPAAAPEAEQKLPADQLDALVAPIALYPDDLPAQTLVASTYPLEIVQLQQWMAKNKNLKDKALADAVAKQPWDPSVQSMAAVPEVVKRLSDDIQWTTDLGN